METLLDNLGYNTYVLKTIRSVTECKKILLYNRNSFISTDYYSIYYGKLNLYNLEDIFFELLYDRNNNTPRPPCIILQRDFSDPLDASNIPFEYNCSQNPIGFNIIIYIDENNSPCGYTEFLNTQGRISKFVKIFLKFNVSIDGIDIKLDNYLYRIKDSLPDNFIGSGLNQFPSSLNVIEEENKLFKDQRYTSHLSSFLEKNNKSSIALCDRSFLPTKTITKISFLKDYNIFSGEEYTNFQIGYYGLDIVLYSWIYLNDDIGYYYRITSLITYEDYKYTHRTVDSIVDSISVYDPNEISKELLYCAGKYLVFKITFNTYSKMALFDTTIDSWVDLKESYFIVDPLDPSAVISELPKPSLIQSYKAALELLPSLTDIFLDVKEYIERPQNLEVLKKFGDWIFIKDSNNIHIASCSYYSVYMTKEEYDSSIVINNNSILIDTNDSYYTIYYGDRRKTYLTEKVRCIKYGSSIHQSSLRGKIIEMSNDSLESEYLEYYKKSEIGIIYKDDLIYNTVLNSYRHQPVYSPYKVPSKIIGAIGGIIFYINSNNNNINYI